jgi:hypothetical protein
MRVGYLTMLVCAGVISRSAVAAPIPENEMFQITAIRSAPDKEKVEAKPTTMPWCPAKYTGDSWETPKFKAAIRLYHDTAAWADAAEHLCEHKEDPTWVRQATYLVQAWMNIENDSQADVEKQIAEKIASLKEERSPAGLAKAEERKFAFGEAEMDEVKPAEGVDLAKVTDKVAWCDVVEKFAIADRWTSSRIHRSIDSTNGIDGKIEGAAHLCQRPTDTTWKIKAGFFLQSWMNWTHLSQADAEKSLRARVQMTKFEAQRTELCKALEVSPEVGGQAKTYAEAQRDLFACKNRGQTLWQDGSQMNTPGVGFYLDGDTQVDEVMRVYWAFGYLGDPFAKSFPATNAGDNMPLLYYAIAQNDLEHIDMAAIEKTLSAAPYNDYARTVMMETVGLLKSQQKAFEKIVDKMTKGDEDYTAILRTAPKKAIAQWDKVAEQWKAEIARSNAFEKLLSQPSRKVLKGCSVDLMKDGEKLVKSFKTNVYKDLVDKISADPVANVLLSRLALCYAADKVWGASGALNDLVSHGRNVRGPRSLAYYAVVDAIAEARKDRPRLLLDLTNFYQSGGVLGGNTNVDPKDFELTGHAPREDEKSGNQGVVGSTKKVEDGLQIVFKKVTLKWPDYDCRDDIRHPLKVNSDGKIEYYQNCKATGSVSTQDMTPNPIVISPLLAAGVKPGAFVRFVEVSAKAKNGNPFAVVAFTKNKSDDKKINSFFGFGL